MLWPLFILLIVIETFLGLFRISQVKKLVLSNNSLELLPESVAHFRNLAELDLSNNGLTFIPESLGTQLTSLTHLAVRNNLITDAEFPKDLSGLARTLKYLNLSGNRFSTFPPQLLQLTGLDMLDRLCYPAVLSAQRDSNWGS